MKDSFGNPARDLRPSVACKFRKEAPHSALAHPYFGGVFPYRIKLDYRIKSLPSIDYKNRLQTKVGTLILTSLLEP